MPSLRHRREAAQLVEEVEDEHHLVRMVQCGQELSFTLEAREVLAIAGA